MNLATKQRRPLAAALAPGDFWAAAWSASGQRVALLESTTGLAEIDVAKGSVSQRFDSGDQLTGVTYVGEEILISRTVWIGDIWVADL